MQCASYMLWTCRTHLVAIMRPFKTILLPYICLRLCAIALAATLPPLGPGQLPKLSLSPNFTSFYDNETFLTLPSSNITSLYDNLTSFALPSSNIALLPNQTLHAASLKDSRLPPDPTSVHYGLATIWYFGYRANVDITEAQAVFRAAVLDCQGHRRQARMATNTKTYTVGRVSLEFTPEAAIYWITWAFVQDKLLAFATKYDYPQFNFAITSPRTDKLLGAGQLKTIDSNRLPPDPFYMEMPQGVVRFSNYGPAIDMINTLRVTTDATMDCFQHPDPTGIIDAGALIYAEGSVSLTLGPGPLMTWGQWKEVVSLIGRFLDNYEYIRFNFDIKSGQEELGSGYLKGSDS